MTTEPLSPTGTPAGATGARRWSRCDSCGDHTPDEVGPILIGVRGWQGSHIDGVRNGTRWEGAVWACKRCAPRVAAGKAAIRTFLGGATTPTMAEFVDDRASRTGRASERTT